MSVNNIIIKELEDKGVKYITGDSRDGVTVYLIKENYHINWGLVHQSGKILCKAKYNGIENFNEGLAVVSDWNFKYGYINIKGEEVIPLTRSRAREFSEDLAPVASGEIGKEKYSYINKSGREIIRTDSPEAFSFCCGLARIENKSFFSKSGFINKEGVIVIPSGYYYATDFNENFTFVSKAFLKAKFALMDTKGKLMTDYLFDSAEKVSDGKALVKINNNYGFLDIESLQFESIGNYYSMLKLNRFTYCIKYNKNDTVIEILDMNLNRVAKLACNDLFSIYRDFEMIPYKKGKFWGLSDLYGNILTDAIYKKIYQENWNIANCYLDGSRNIYMNSRGESL